MSKKIIVIITVVAIILGTGAIVWEYLIAATPDNSKTLPLARCLAEKKATMYGTYWCPHCQNQKKMFGDSFSVVPYVECSQEIAKCQEAKVEAFPTWIFADGTRHVGEYKTLDDLAKDAGCPAISQ